jgi:DNA-directed RNA polymerase specialized sigma24 family protein
MASRSFRAGSATATWNLEDGAGARADRRQATPSTEAAWTEEILLIGQAMQRLPEDYLRILCLHMKPDQDHQRTARLMNRSEGASRVLLARARAALLVELDRLRKGQKGETGD